LYDHIENVVATVSDRRLFQTSGGSTDKNAEVVSATGYYPYGSQQPGRTVNAELYDYGYQGQEKDNELQVKGNSYYFTSRIYDSRLGRWLSTDPKNMKSPEESPYAGMGNNPVSMVDPRGQQKYWCEWCGESYAFVLNDYIGEQWINPFLTEEFDKNYQEWFRKKMVNDPTFRSKQIKNYEALIGVLQRIEAAGDIAEAGLMLYGGGGAVIKSAKGLKAAGLVKATAGTFKLSFSIFATGAGVAGKTTEGISEGVTGEQYQGPRIGKVASFEFAGEAFFGEKGKIVGAALDKFLVFRGYLKGLNKKEITETIENASTIEKIDKTVEFLKKLKEAKEMGEKAGEAAAELEQTIERLEEKKKELEEEKEAEDSFDSYSAPDNAVYCFEAGTQVLMADGSQKNIEDVDAGDMVKTFNKATGKIENNEVKNMTEKQRSDMIRIEFGNNTVNTNSADHPYYVPGKGWCSYTPKLSSQRYDLDVSQLEVGDECYEYSNGNVQKVQVHSIEELNITLTTYNLDVISNSNTYFANGILVHNK
jgi:RHS repeat-associated protein